MIPISRLVLILVYAAALCGIAPLFTWLGPLPRTALAIGLVAGIWQNLRGAWPIKPWMLNSAIVPIFLYYAGQFSRSAPVQPVVSVLALMLAVRLAGDKSVRHCLQIQVLSLFCLSSSTLFDLRPSFLFYLVVLLLLVALLLVLLTFQKSTPDLCLNRDDLRRILAAGLLMPLASFPLMLLFFPIMPRTQLPLWNFLAAPAARVTGYSDTVEPGGVAALAESQAVAFRAEMPRQPPERLYWRGTVFSRIEGKRWLRRVPVIDEHPLPSGQGISQTIYPEPGMQNRVLALDAPVSVGGIRTRRANDGIFEYAGYAGKRLVYTANSYTGGVLRTAQGVDRRIYREVPPDLSPRITALAAGFRARGTDDAGRLELVEDYFRTGGFRYSMTGLPTGDDALERFLFSQRQGHCEFFASSFAILLRSAGVPARLVGGYLGGEYNQLGGYYLISEKMAHVWVEAHIAGKGWVRIDPSALAANAGDVLGKERRRSLLLNARLVIDSLDHIWTRAVVTYDFEQQVALVRNAGRRFQGVTPARLVRTAAPYTLAILFLAGAVGLWKHRGRLLISRDQRLLLAFESRVRRDAGCDLKLSNTGVLGLADACGNPLIRRFAEVYGAAIYHDRALTNEEYQELAALCRQGFRGMKT